MKIYIAYETTNSPHGGGNQFLRALKEQFKKYNLYIDSPIEADVILFNSHQNYGAVLNLKSKFPDKCFIHRVDGPMRLYNNMSDTRDDIVYQLNNRVADGTVFQSTWSKVQNFELGMHQGKFSTVIQNSVDTAIFNSSGANKREKTRLISTSFSPNYRKGHKYYQFLDEHLDFEKYEYVFVGKSPIGYTNIKMLGCLDSHGVANELKNSCMYITASENDPCSNSLLEAIACGLPILALNSGGHPEIVRNNNSLFNNEEELLNKIGKLVNFNATVSIDTMEAVSQKYLNFFKEVLHA